MTIVDGKLSLLPLWVARFRRSCCGWQDFAMAIVGDKLSAHGMATAQVHEPKVCHPHANRTGSPQYDANRTGSPQYDANRTGSPQYDVNRTGSPQYDAGSNQNVPVVQLEDRVLSLSRVS